MSGASGALRGWVIRFLNRQPSAPEGFCREFLPAVAEVEESPPSPVGRTLLWTLMILFAIAVAAAWWGRVDTVAVARGRIIASEGIKVVQSLEPGRIAGIHVREGESVEAGQTLITLEQTEVMADQAQVREALLEAGLSRARLRAFEAWIATLGNPSPSEPLVVHWPDTAPASQVQEHRRLLDQQVAAMASRILALEAEQQEVAAERMMARETAAGLAAIMPIIEERFTALQSLSEQDFVPRLQLLEAHQVLIEKRQQLAAQRAAETRLDAVAEATRERYRRLVNETREQNQHRLLELNQQIQRLAQEQVKINAQQARRVLVSPIAGTVQQLQVHTRGGVVGSGQTLLHIVPADSTLEVEAAVLNRDIGFVWEGQPAAIKLDTFNFTQYGLLNAEVMTLSDDAVANEQLGWTYLARLALETTQVQVGDRLVDLSPGMAVTVEIRTGTRRVIQYFLSPLLRYLDEAIRER